MKFEDKYFTKFTFTQNQIKKNIETVGRRD